MYLNRGYPASVEQALDDSEEAERRITVATEQIRNDLSRAPRPANVVRIRRNSCEVPLEFASG